MVRLWKRVILSIILVFSLLIASLPFRPLYADVSYPVNVRIAILDNFTAEQFPQKYRDAYFAGINTAVSAAKEKGFNIEYKFFAYGNDPLDVLNSVSSVKAWNPDFIIGPHSSNQFLLLKKYFNDILVISPYATDQDITKMPSNFYSLSLPDAYMAKANLLFMDKYFPGRDVFNIFQADCKDCVDVTNIFNELYRATFPKASLTNSFYVGDDIKNLNLQKVMSNYKKGSVIILQPLSYSDANYLMAAISNFLKDPNLIFLYNLDNWGNSKEAKKITSNPEVNYISFKVSPLILGQKTKIFNEFSKNYQREFHVYPFNAVSYMTYISVMSAVDASKQFPSVKTDSEREAILSSFLTSLRINQNWYRPNTYIISRLEPKGEEEIGGIAVFQ